MLFCLLCFTMYVGRREPFLSQTGTICAQTWAGREAARRAEPWALAVPAHVWPSL